MPYLCSLPYWRKSWWNPFTCRPVVMMLEGQRLRAWDKHEALLYDTSVTEVHAHLSRLQTLVLHMNGQKWVFYGRGSGSSPDPTPGQRDAVKRFLHAHSEEPLPPNVGALAWPIRYSTNPLAGICGCGTRCSWKPALPGHEGTRSESRPSRGDRIPASGVQSLTPISSRGRSLDLRPTRAVDDGPEADGRRRELWGTVMNGRDDYEEAQASVTAALVRVTDEITDWITTQPDGLVELRPWLTPNPLQNPNGPRSVPPADNRPARSRILLRARRSSPNGVSWRTWSVAARRASIAVGRHLFGVRCAGPRPRSGPRGSGKGCGRCLDERTRCRPGHRAAVCQPGGVR